MQDPPRGWEQRKEWTGCPDKQPGKRSCSLSEERWWPWLVKPQATFPCPTSAQGRAHCSTRWQHSSSVSALHLHLLAVPARTALERRQLRFLSLFIKTASPLNDLEDRCLEFQSGKKACRGQPPKQRMKSDGLSSRPEASPPDHETRGL